MKLYDFVGAPNPRRTRIFVAEKGLELDVENVDVAGGANRTREFLKKSPLGLLPVLELDDGTCITESVAICRYLEGVQPEPALMGVDARDAAIVEMWNRRMELELFQNVGHYFRNTAAFFKDRYEQSPLMAQEARRFALEAMARLDGALANRPFVAGERFTIADITAWVAVDLGIPSVFELSAELTNLSRWFASVSSRPSVAGS